MFETEGMQHGNGYDMGISLRNPNIDKTVNCKFVIFNKDVSKEITYTLEPKEIKAFMFSSMGIPAGFYQAYVRGAVGCTCWLMKGADVQCAIKLPIYAL